MTSTPDKEKIRMILKFDTGADGFKKMILTLALTAVLVVAAGLYFVLYLYPQSFP